MRILLIGTTGRTGRFVLQEALSRGHQVHALVRDLKKLPTHSNLVPFEGNPAHPVALNKAFGSCEAIISTLNISRYNDFPWTGLRTPKDFLSNVMRQLIVLQPARLIFTSAWGVGDTRGDLPGWFRWLVDHSNLRYPYLDHERQEELVQQSSLNWTAARPVFLSNARKLKPPQAGFTGKPNLFISRRNLAVFLLNCLEEGSFVREKPVVWE